MLGLIWANARGGVIGLDGDMPWYVPEDFAHFKAVTTGHTVIMGRRTWESLQVHPLPHRLNIVVSRQALDLPAGAVLAGSITEALSLAAQSGDGEAWCIGGGSLYAELVDRADRIEVTELDLEVTGDTHAPAIPPGFVSEVDEWFESREGVRYRFIHYHRTQ
ncbi:MAG TPA: dihydrofolate reductase [Microbacteriaceae bacterium]|nr:dihydrofolate reductase [Microbacteriaceae bacterium]